MIYTMRRNRGFTLLELAVVIAISALILGAVAVAVRGYMKTLSRDDLMSSEVRELAQLDRAVRDKLKDNTYINSLTVGTAATLTVATLISENRLPTNFANRVGANGKTPFGQNYLIRVRRIAPDTTNNIPEQKTAVIYEDLATKPLVSRMRRSEIADTTEQIRGLKQTIASKSSSKSLVGAVVGPGTRSAVAPNGSFTKDLSAYFPSNATYHNAAVLVGFYELEPRDGGGTGGPGDDFPYQDCIVQPAACSSGAIVCTSGAYEQTCASPYTRVDAFPHCGYQTTTITSTVIGAVTFGERVETQPSHNNPFVSGDSGGRLYGGFGTCLFESNNACANSPPYVHTIKFGQVILNSSVISESVCHLSDYFTNFPSRPPSQIVGTSTTWPANSTVRDVICCR